MARAILLVIVGALAGSAALAFAFRAGAFGVGALPPEPLAAAPQPLPEGIRAPDAFDISRAAHERAAQLSDPTALVLAVERTVDEAASVPRDAEFDALLARLAELDPASAADLAQRLELDEARLSRLFQAWAAVDPQAALQNLGRLRPPSVQRAVALSLLDIFGFDDTGVEHVAAALTPARASHFRIDAIGRRAERNVASAIDDALGLGFTAAQTVALQHIADTMALIDPRAALEQAAMIPTAIQRRMYRERVLDSWARVDPEAMLAYFESADLSEMPINPDAFRAVAATDPARLLELAGRLPPSTRRNAQTAALEALVDIDPVSAYAALIALPPSGDRDQLTRSVAARYAQQDPNDALAWAASLQPPSQLVMDTVLTSVAASDPQRVAEIAIAEILDPAAANRGAMPNIASYMQAAMRAGSPGIAQVASMLATHSDPRVRNQLTTMLMSWPGIDMPGALDWVLANPQYVDSGSAQQFAFRLAANDVAGASQAFNRMPSDLRSSWAAGIATALARSDLDGAIQWLERLDGDPLYDNTRSSLLTAAAGSQPETVARLLTDSDSDVALIPAIALQWAASDPAAAAAWLTSQGNLPGQPRAGAISDIASSWAHRDPAGAQRWVFEQPAGAARDAGLTGLVLRAAAAGTIDPQLLTAFSAPGPRASAIADAMMDLGRSNPDLGRQLIEEHIRDPAQKRMAEQRLESGVQRRLTLMPFDGIVLP